MKRRQIIGVGVAVVPLLLLYFRRGLSTLWADEASSVWFSRLSWYTILTQLCDPHPPGYYLFLKLWSLPGANELWLRLPSLLLAGGAVYITYWLCKELGYNEIAWFAALLLLFQPLQWWYGGEVRMYALAQFCGITAVWLAVRFWTREGEKWNGALYVVAAMATLWSDTTGVLAWGVAQLLWLAYGRPKARAWLILQLFVWIPILIVGITSGWLPLRGGSYQPIFVAIQAAQFGVELSPATAGRWLLVGIATFLIASVSLAAIWPRINDKRQLVRWIVIASVLLWTGWLLLAAVPRLYTVKRLIIVLLPFLAIAVTHVRRGRVLLLIGGYIITVWVLTQHPHPPWRATITDLMAQESVVWVDEQYAPLFSYYAGDQPAQWEAVRYFDVPQAPSLAPAIGDDLILVGLASPYRVLEATLPDSFFANYAPTATEVISGIELSRYTRLAEPVVPENRPNPGPIVEWQRLLPSPLALCDE